jgi:light-harvesting complex II chlorophyll a/b binding protein 4
MLHHVNAPNAFALRTGAPAMAVSEAPPIMSASGNEVVSWYDSGIRLTAEAEAADVPAASPASSDGSSAYAAGGLSWSMYDDSVDVDDWRVRMAAVSAAERKKTGPRRCEWNPDGILFPLQTGALKDQVVTEYVKLSPPYLNGEFAGDVGFDPLCLVALAKPTKASGGYVGGAVPKTATQRQEAMLAMNPQDRRKNVMWMREAEIKHARLAMLAAAGWPMAEIINGGWLKQVAGTGGRAPALLNGGLGDMPTMPFLVLAAVGMAYLETKTLDNVEGLTKTGYVPGDLGFDPLGYSTGTGLAAELPKGPPYPNLGDMRKLQTSEIKHGRAAMVAITGFVAQEALWRTPVVDLPISGFFFGR